MTTRALIGRCITLIFTMSALHLKGQVATNEEEIAFNRSIEGLKNLTPQERIAKLTKLVQLCDLLVGGRTLEVVSTAGKISPPSVLVGGKYGWIPGSESEPVLARLFPASEQKQVDAKRAILCWGIMFNLAPAEALHLMTPRLTSPAPDVVDAIHLIASTHRQPGLPFKMPISKALWQRFYDSPNPCYKILALEKYDSTDQSPDELLKLYRECLFGSFGYLQVRALEGIYRNKDYRDAVRDLLREYLKSNPVEDDGTLPSFPWVIRDPIKGAKLILTEINNLPTNKSSIDTVSATQQQTSTMASAITPTAAKTPVANNNKPAAQSLEPASTPWLAWAAIIGAALGLLWLVLKKRRSEN